MFDFIKKDENRILKDIRIAFAILPLILVLPVLEYFFRQYDLAFFKSYYDEILVANVIYIVLARFALLDSAVYIFSKSKHPVHLALINIVFLYLEVTIITIVYYALVYDIFDPFSLFHLNSNLQEANLQSIHQHSFITSMYISAVTFTTLGSGDWIPQTIPAMLAVISEVILGVVQGGVFVAILIYAHQTKK